MLARFSLLSAACEASSSPFCLLASTRSSSSCLVCSDFFFSRACSLAFSCGREGEDRRRGEVGREWEGSRGEEGREQEGSKGRGVEGEEVARVGGEGGGVRTGSGLHTHYTGHVVPECVGGVTHLLELVVFHLDLGVVLDALFGVVLSNQTVVLCQQSGALLKAV